MASIFPKGDPKDKSVKRWMGKIKIGKEWRAFSLRIRAIPGTKREAQARADSLEFEIKAGTLSDTTKAWLGDIAANKLAVEIGRAGAVAGAGAPACWRTAADAWLAAHSAKDSRVVAEGRVKSEEKTKVSRRMKMKVIVDWATESGVPFMREPFTDVAIRFIKHRVEKGIKSNTLWNGDFSTICTFGEWLAARRICEPINRDRIREVMPQRPVASITLPSWRDDLECLRFCHKIRKYGDWAGGMSGRGGWKRYRSHQSIWAIVLVTRGLGCRPSEATALSWATVDFAGNRVKFIDSKNKRSRTVPILFEWVRSGIAELWEWHGKPVSGPVCRNWQGKVWTSDSSASDLLRRIFEELTHPLVHFKEMQKLQIAQLIRVGFPPHVVAHWSDHTLSVQERHYYEGDSYLPPEDDYNFGEFGDLSDYGRKVLQHQGAYSRDMAVE